MEIKVFVIRVFVIIDNSDLIRRTQADSLLTESEWNELSNNGEKGAAIGGTGKIHAPAAKNEAESSQLKNSKGNEKKDLKKPIQTQGSQKLGTSQDPKMPSKRGKKRKIPPSKVNRGRPSKRPRRFLT